MHICKFLNSEEYEQKFSLRCVSKLETLISVNKYSGGEHYILAICN